MKKGIDRITAYDVKKSFAMHVREMNTDIFDADDDHKEQRQRLIETVDKWYDQKAVDYILKIVYTLP